MMDLSFPMAFLLLILFSLSNSQAFSQEGVNKFPSTRNLRLQPSAASGHCRLIKAELVNQNTFSVKQQAPSVSFHQHYNLAAPSSQLSVFHIRSLFRSAEVSSTETSSSTSSSQISPSTAVTNIRTLLTSAPHSAIQSLASLELTSTASRISRRASQRLISSNRWVDYVIPVVRFATLYWWTLPLFCALVPLYTTYVMGTGDAFMPHWWPVTRMDHIVESANAAVTVGFFLFSNIAYFLSGAYLVKKFPFVRPETLTSTAIRPCQASSSDSTISIFVFSAKNRLQSFKVIPTRKTWLGLLLLASGVISSIFHTEQALGSYAIANSLCYLDHAIAGTSTFYYFHTCSRPSGLVWALGIAGLTALSIPHPSYAWLHSAWHFLSAGAAVLWALESFDDKPLDISVSSSESMRAAGEVTTVDEQT